MRAMAPPPAPMLWMSRAGSRKGRPAIVRWAAGSGTPPRTRHTSVLVPPMSSVITSGNPAAMAAAAPAWTPPAGPDSSSVAGLAAAWSIGTRPPADVITRTSSAMVASRARYSRQVGPRWALTTVVTVRSYSRNSGETSLERHTGTPAEARRVARSRSWESSRSACSRQTASASTPPGTAGSSGDSGSSWAPVASRRPDTSSRSWRGTRGSGRSTDWSYSAGRSWRAISITSAKPAVVTSATLAPRRSSSALVATVVPWASRSGRGCRRRASTTASEGSCGVEGTLSTLPSSTTTSVNVPPVSTPTATVAVLPDVGGPVTRAAHLGTGRLQGQAIDEVVVGIDGMSLHPPERDPAVRARQLDQRLPQVLVGDGLPPSVAPALSQPGLPPPLSEAVNHVGRVAHHLHRRLHRSQRLEGGGDLHALVGCHRFGPAGEAASGDGPGPSSGARVPDAGAVGVHGRGHHHSMP